jgi:hypothetical protein
MARAFSKITFLKFKFILILKKINQVKCSQRYLRKLFLKKKQNMFQICVLNKTFNEKKHTLDS